MSRLDFLLLAVILLLPSCSSGPIFDEDYYTGDEKDDYSPEAFPDSEIPAAAGLAILFGYDRNDDEPNFYSDYRPRNQLAVPENITRNRPLSGLGGVCPLTPKAFARMQHDPERPFQEIKQPPEVRTLLPRKQVEPPATIDDLISGVCADVIIIWARGTCNTGNIGSALGRCFFTYLKGNLDYTVIGQGVLPYAADIMSFIRGGCKRGAQSMATMVMLAVEQCPQSKIVLGGFSQGAQVLRKAVKRIPSSAVGNIVAVVSFSDPNEGQPLESVLEDRHVSFCHDGDWVCDGESTFVTGRHKSAYYFPQLGAAFDFVESRLVEEGIPVRAHLVWSGVEAEAEGESG